MGRDEHTTDDYQNRNGGGNEYTLNEIRDDMPTWKKNLLAKKNGEIMVWKVLRFQLAFPIFNGRHHFGYIVISII